MGTRKAFIQRFALGPCCTSRVAIISHIGIAWTMVLTQSALFAGLICEGLADPQGCGPDAVHLFPCCPRSLFHMSCLASLTPVDGRVWCPTCPEDVRSGVDADWFERQCHINGVDSPADPGCGVCTVCVEEMTVDSSIEVPCCHQRLHVTCLARSFSSRGVDCPFCNQSIAEFARSSSFLASSLFHGCLVDLDDLPSNRRTISLVLPLGFPRPPDDLTLMCCPRSGPPPDLEESTDRRMEWSPQQLSNQWDPQWLCLRCGRSMELSQIPQRPDIVCSQCGVNCPTMIMDCREGSRWMEISHVQPVSPTWFSHGPLTTLGRLYAWVIVPFFLQVQGRNHGSFAR